MRRIVNKKMETFNQEMTFIFKMVVKTVIVNIKILPRQQCRPIVYII